MNVTVQRIVIPLCVAMGMIEGYDIQIIGVIAPALVAAFRLIPSDLGWLFFASNLGMLVGAVGGGWLADRFGRRPVLIASATIFASFTLGVALAMNFPMLLGLRVLAGLGLGAALPNLVATAVDITSADRRGVVNGLMFCGVPLGGAAVALLSQAMPAVIGWRELFAIGGALPLFVAVLLWRHLPETRSAHDGEYEPPRLRALFRTGQWRSTILLWLAIAPTLMALYLILYWLPTLVVAKGLSAATGAQASAAFNLAGAVGAVAVGFAADRWRGPKTLIAAYIAFLAVTFLIAPATGRVAVISLSAAAGFLLLGVNYAAYGLAGSLYPARIRATGSGAAVGVGRVGSIVGPLLPGLLLSRGAGPTAVIWLLAPAALLAAVALFFLSDPFRRSDAHWDFPSAEK